MSSQTRTNDRRIVWSDQNLDIEDWREGYKEYLEANELDLDPDDEQAIYEWMVETNEEYLSDERMNLDIQLSIVSEAERDVAEREAMEREVPTKTMGERIVEEAMGKAKQRERNEQENPTAAKTEKSPLSEQRLERDGTPTDKGAVKPAEKKPTVKKKLEGYKRQAAKQKEAERVEPETGKDKAAAQGKPQQTVHQRPAAKKKKTKER